MPEATKKALYDLISSPTGAQSSDGIVKRALHAIRSHLGMEVAYVSEFVGDRAVFREVDAPGLEAVIKPGNSQSLDDIFCRHILEGRLPELIPDTSAEPLAMSLPIMQKVPIGQAHERSDPHAGRQRLRHVLLPRLCARPLAAQARPQHDARVRRSRGIRNPARPCGLARDAKKSARASSRRWMAMALTIVYQPIYDIETGKPVGLESLSRFSATPLRTPDQWFTEAAETGLGIDARACRDRAGRFRRCRTFRNDRLPVGERLAGNDPLRRTSRRAMDGCRPPTASCWRSPSTRRWTSYDAPEHGAGAVARARPAHRDRRRRRGLREPAAHPSAAARHHQARHGPDAQHRSRSGAARARAWR